MNLYTDITSGPGISGLSNYINFTHDQINIYFYPLYLNSKSFKYFLAAILLLTCQSIFPQVKSIGIPYVRNYELSDIQAGVQTWMIDLSKEGLVYFANNDGVLEFDGLHWRIYPLPGGIVVRSVKTTENGRIYAGGFNQIGYFSPAENRGLIFNSLLHLIPDHQKDFGEVWKIYELPSGLVFQSFQQLMIYKDEGIQIIRAPETFHFSFLVNNELYINDQTQGLYRLAHDRLVKIPGTDRLRGQLIWAMLPKGNNMLIATADNGIFEFNGMDLKAWTNPAFDILQENQVYCGMQISEKIYAFGTIQDGLVICDTAGNILQHINLKKGLQNNTVLSMRLDNYGNLWLGMDNGIDYVEINSPLTYFSHFHSLSAGYTAVLHDGLLYFGTNRGVFYHDWNRLQSDGGDQEFKIIPGTQGQVWSLKVVDGTLFCGHNSGIFTISGTEARLISDVQGGWTFLQPSGRNDVLICGTYTWLVKFEKKDNIWQEGVKIKGFTESSRLLANAGQNMIWMTHGYKGVFRIRLDENCDSVTRVEFYDRNYGLPSEKNINVFEVFGEPVFTTEYGFYKYDVRTNSFLPHEEMSAFYPGDHIHELHQDSKGNIWYFTLEDAGVYRLQEDGSYVNVELPFRELKGKFIKWFQFVYPLSEEHVFFGTQDGFVHYTPEYPKNYQLPFSTFIRGVKFSGYDSVVYQGGSSAEISLAGIPYKFNQLQFEYSANDFENPQRMQFSTFLEGFDNDWTTWQRSSMREFTNLRHGKYRFHVKAKNIFNAESNTSTLLFEIYPPWYLKWWAYLIYFLAFLICIFLLAKYVRYRMEKSICQEEERQKQLFKEREKQLQTEALEAEKEVIRLSNEKLYAEMKQKDMELANSTMQMIQKSKSLISIKKELSQLSREIGDDLITHHINSMIRKINREIDTEKQWEIFEKHFESVHEEFLKRLKARYPHLTPREMKLCAYLRLNISSKEIATLMNISTRGVEISRYRLRKKLSLEHDHNLTDFIMSF